MRYCANCGEVFAAYESGTGACPVCGLRDDVTAAGQCRECGDLLPPDDIQGGLCPRCRAAVQKAYTAFWDSLSPAQQDYILDTDYHPAG